MSVPFGRYATDLSADFTLAKVQARTVSLTYVDTKAEAARRKRQAQKCSNPEFARRAALVWTTLADSEANPNRKLSYRIGRRLIQVHGRTVGNQLIAQTAYMDAHHIIPRLGKVMQPNQTLLAYPKCLGMAFKLWPNSATNGVMLPGHPWVHQNPRKPLPRTDHRAISSPAGEQVYARCLGFLLGGSETVTGFRRRMALAEARLRQGTLVRVRGGVVTPNRCFP
jgi:hypothetical protein